MDKGDSNIKKSDNNNEANNNNEGTIIEKTDNNKGYDIINDESLIIKLSDFIILKFIGQGSFGKIYTVKEKSTSKIYAAKISKKTISQLSNDIIREINILSKIKHPSILKYVGYSPMNFKHKQKPVIITEYASNGSLSDILQLERDSKTPKGWNWTQKLICIYGIAVGMLFLHSNNIIHRDLKPDNILIDKFFLPKISDFGLSKMNETNKKSFFKSTTTTSNIKGTPIYISPEIWKNGEYSKPGDVYSFGFIVYEIVTGEKPYSNINLYELISKVGNKYRPEFKKPIPHLYRKLIEDCWAENPSDRPTFIEIVLRLRENDGFITDSVDKNLFINYINHINKFEKEYNSLKNVIFNNDLFQMFSKATYLYQSDNKVIKIVNDYSNSIKICPVNIYTNFNKDQLEIILQAELNLEKQFDLAKMLIEAKEPFQQNVELGIKYLENLMNNNQLNSIIYYCEMIIQGEIIPRNLKKARKIIEKYLLDNKSVYHLLVGKILKKEKKYKEALESFEKSVSLGNSEAYFEYGWLLFRGKGIEANKDKGIEYLEESIKKGCVQCMTILGLCLYSGEKGFEQNKEKGTSYIKMASEKHYPIALYNYALLVYNGLVNGVNKDTYLEYLKEAAFGGYPEALYQYSMKLISDENNLEKCLYFLKKASDKGHMNSLNQYALSLYSLKDDKRSNESVKYLKILANKDFEKAMYTYAYCLFNGKGIEENKEESVIYLKKLADKDNIDGIDNYAYCLLMGEGIEKNTKEALKYYKIAIEKGNANSEKFYAEMLYNGIEIEQNKKEAAKYYKISADKGIPYSMYFYGKMLFEGDGIEKNVKEGIKYIKQACEKNFIKALLYWSNIESSQYAKDIEIYKDDTLKYYKNAADQGSYTALNNYALKLYEGDGIETNKEEGKRLLKMAADNCSITSIENYARILIKDSEINEQNIKEILKYLKISADFGKVNSMSLYARLILFDFNFEFLKIAFNFYKIGDEDSIEYTNIVLQVMKNDDIVINNDAIKYFKMAIEKGNDKVSMHYLANIYFNKKCYSDHKIEGIKLYKMAADNGVVDAMLKYGLISYLGDGIPINYNEAIKYLKMAADNNNIEAIYNYGLLNANGQAIPINIPEAIKYLKIAADSGHIKAAINYAYIYYYGIDVEVNKKEAYNYYKIAAEKGDFDSIKICAYMNYKGDGIPVNNEESFRFYKMAADKGDIDSIAICGIILRDWDENDLKKKAEAAEYLKLAMDKGSIDGLVSYACILFVGNGIQMNKPEAARLFKVAIEKGDNRTLCYLADMLNEGDGIPVNKEEALKYYKIAINNGQQDAYPSYADFLYNDNSNPENKELAIKYFKMAVENGSSRGMRLYAQNLYNDDSIPNNKVEAIKLFKMSADNNNDLSMLKYAEMLLIGEGAPVNIDEAVKYLKLAIENGNSNAMTKYGLMLKNGDGVPKNIDEAVKYFKLAIEKGDSKAMYFYGMMLHYGDGIDVNKEEAAKYYQMSIEKGETLAKEELEKLNKYKD